MEKMQAIIVLGGGINQAGQIPEHVVKRIDRALELSHGKIPIIMAGKWSLLITYTPPTTEARAMRDYALQHSPSANPDLFLLEENSMDTVGNACFSGSAFLETRNWRNILLITSEFHIPRSRYIFEKVLGPSYRLTFEATSSGLSADELANKITMENKVLNFCKQLLEPLPTGDLQAVRNMLETMPGYSPSPRYSREQLLGIIHTGSVVPDMYGLSGS
ncbi:MAG TPA: YdcF family protein [Candidatus Acidoferrum sp.]|nr:YdcF family protein [Candidatus Acidoferrum sp.]